MQLGIIGQPHGQLHRVAGPELLAVTPDTREDYLYDDIIDAEIALREHRRFVAILERFAEVLSVRDLVHVLAERPFQRGDDLPDRTVISDGIDDVGHQVLAASCRGVEPRRCAHRARQWVLRYGGGRKCGRLPVVCGLTLQRVHCLV